MKVWHWSKQNEEKKEIKNKIKNTRLFQIIFNQIK